MSYFKQLGYEDAFGTLVTHNTTNEIDLASHYPYSPKRYRLFVDGTRQFPEYTSVPQYNHATDVHELMPASGETVIFQSAERARYVVQYEIVPTWAFQLNQSLVSGDRLRLGLFDDNDGWYLEQTGGHNDNQVDLYIRRAGSDIKSETDLDLDKTTLDFTRPELRVNWYNVGAARWRQTYTSGNAQINTSIGSISIDDGGRGPQKGNLPLRYEITASNSTSGLKLEAGSMVVVTEGNVSNLKREKTASIQTSSTSIDDTGIWKPFAALRKDPNRTIISTELIQLDIGEFSGTGDVRIMAKAVDASKTDASGFAVPDEQISQDSVIQQTTNISTFSDNLGNVVSSGEHPGGSQLGYVGLYEQGGFFGLENSRQNNNTTKRDIFDDDIIVLLYNSTDTGDIKLDYVVEQDW